LIYAGKKQKFRDYAKKQYQTSTPLQKRIQLWSLGSNQMPFHLWIFQKIVFQPFQHILVLGAGTRNLWKHNLTHIPPNQKIILSDFSQAMVTHLIKEFSGKYPGFTFKKIDAQRIPFSDDSFDILIANHMLYHVPNLELALHEIARVLTPQGSVYGSTIATEHTHEIYHLLETFGIEISAQKAEIFSEFHLQSGKTQLETFFNHVELLRYENIVHTTEDCKEVLFDYIDSWFLSKDSSSYWKLRGKIQQKIREHIKQQGNFQVSGQSGILIASHPKQ
jgi:ubiquinone/menaquinone biosynthesis C-methylase UbiE